MENGLEYPDCDIFLSEGSVQAARTAVGCCIEVTLCALGTSMLFVNIYLQSATVDPAPLLLSNPGRSIVFVSNHIPGISNVADK